MRAVEFIALASVLAYGCGAPIPLCEGNPAPVAVRVTSPNPVVLPEMGGLTIEGTASSSVVVRALNVGPVAAKTLAGFTNFARWSAVLTREQILALQPFEDGYKVRIVAASFCAAVDDAEDSVVIRAAPPPVLINTLSRNDDHSNVLGVMPPGRVALRVVGPASEVGRRVTLSTTLGALSGVDALSRVKLRSEEEGAVAEFVLSSAMPGTAIVSTVGTEPRMEVPVVFAEAPRFSVSPLNLVTGNVAQIAVFSSGSLKTCYLASAPLGAVSAAFAGSDISAAGTAVSTGSTTPTRIVLTVTGVQEGQARLECEDAAGQLAGIDVKIAAPGGG